MVTRTVYTNVQMRELTDIARNAAVEEVFVANLDVVDGKRIWVTQRSSNTAPMRC